MGRLLLVEPLAVAAIGGTLPGAARLLTPDPREACGRFASGASRTIDIDLGASRAIDTIFLGYVVSAQMPPIAVGTGLNGQGESQLDTSLVAAASLGGANQHYLLVLSTPLTTRYLRLTLALGPGGSAGVLAIGKALRPEFGQEWGGGRPVGDSSIVTRLQGGGLAIDEGATWGGYQWTFGDLSDSEVESLYQLARRCGTRRPLLLVEDPAPTAGLAERVHWGVFTKFDPYERRSRERTRWAMQVEDWV